MKPKNAIIVIIDIILASLQFHTEAESRLEMRHLFKESFKSAEHSDSTDNIMKMSNEGSGSLIDRVIPMSPQAASLARYAEYPVSHTTGIPDITIPLYEIRMGAFTLPISISYHSSGTRPDEIPTSVGLGWTLNAGGAITRSILGGPDIQTAPVAESDFKYYKMSEIQKLLSSITDAGGNNHLTELLSCHESRDSESDRYTFNAGGHTGVFLTLHQPC